MIDSRRRLRIVWFGLLAMLAVVFGRVVQLEVSQGAAFREEASRPLERRKELDGVRGRILAQNGTVLALDTKVLALAVHYRYLEQPANPRWLRATARARLPKAQRRDAQGLAEEEARIEAERVELRERLAGLCRLSRDEWDRRERKIQSRVESIAERVNRRRLAEFDRRSQEARNEDASASDSASLAGRIKSALLDALRDSIEEPAAERITVAEELDYHWIADDVPLAVVAEVEANPARYPGVKIVEHRRRAYPSGTLASHVIGHLGPPEETAIDETTRPEDRVGRMGLERQYEALLRGRPGTVVESIDRSGRVLLSRREVEPGIGRDLVLTLDPALQSTAESLLDAALERIVVQASRLQEQDRRDARTTSAGGAVVVMDVRNGAIMAAASAPRFDPGLFAAGDEAKLARLLADPGHPLFDRATRMAIPPGSVFKTVSAVAMLEAAAVDPKEPFTCQGYLSKPDEFRCAIYRRQGIGHGEIGLADALAQSCNVYFFHHAGRLGPEALTDWAARFGFGQPTGADLPDEAAGTLPTPGTIEKLQRHAWRAADSQMLAVGQGALQATPLQVVRMMAAIANGGLLVTPHVVRGLGLPAVNDGESAADLAESDDSIRLPPPRPIPGLKPATLAAVREGLQHVVSDPRGTAHATVFLDSLSIAGKTGTAETDLEGADHAWFAGYAPAENPKVAFVVVLEHAGNAGDTAGPVAKRLALRMQQLGYFGK